MLSLQLNTKLKQQRTCKISLNNLFRLYIFYMEWLYELIFGTGVAHGILILSLVISIGILLGKVKICGVSLGITWILFIGIFFGHLGLGIDENVLQFLKEFGLILFIYSIGMQVGPSFFFVFQTRRVDA